MGHVGGHAGPGEVTLTQAVEVPDYQGAPIIQAVRTGVCVAHAGVEVKQEEVVDDRGVGTTDPVTAFVVHPTGPGGQVGHHVGVEHVEAVSHLGGM